MNSDSRNLVFRKSKQIYAFVIDNEVKEGGSNLHEKGTWGVNPKETRVVLFLFCFEYRNIRTFSV